MASMLESTALWRKEDLRLGYVWIGVEIFARHHIGTFGKNFQEKLLYQIPKIYLCDLLLTAILALCRTWSRYERLDGLPSSEPLLTGIQARDQVLQRGLLQRNALHVNRLFGLYSSCISHVSVPDPDLEIGVGHPDPEIGAGGGLQKVFFGPLGLG